MLERRLEKPERQQQARLSEALPHPEKSYDDEGFVTKDMKKALRVSKHKRVRKNIIGVTDRPRVAVFKSGQHIYAQVIDDSKGATLVAESDIKIKVGTKTEKATKVGEALAQKAIKAKITKIVFERGGFSYHGRVAALAEGLRKGGLQF